MNDEHAARTSATSRWIDAPPARAYAAFADPHQLARWWGPAGFRNTFDVFEPRPAGRWRFTMHGPDGRNHPNESVFVELLPAQRVVFRHLSGHFFEMTVHFEPEGKGTRIRWQQVFDSSEHYQRIRSSVDPANEQNLDRLQAHLAADIAADRAAEAAGQRAVEVRAYKLKPGTRTAFHARMVEVSVPLLRAWSTDVVAFGPVPNETDGYHLLRAYRDVADLEARQAEFYGSAAWRQGPREAILAAIDSHVSTVLWLSPASIEDLRRRNTAPPAA